MNQFATIFLDIETRPSAEKPSLEEITPPANYTKEETILKYKIENQDLVWRKTALSSLDGGIFCIGLAVDDEEPFTLYNENEELMLNELADFLKLYDYYNVVAHNGLKFDYLFIFHKALKYNIKYLIKIFNGSMKNLEDTMKMLDGTGYNTMVSLDKACKLLGIEGKGDISGKDVHDFILAGKFDEIRDYCKSDVTKVRILYNRMK